MNDPHVICIVCGADRACYSGEVAARPTSMRRDMRNACPRIDKHQDKPCSFITLGATEALEFSRRHALREDPRIEEAAE